MCGQPKKIKKKPPLVASQTVIQSGSPGLDHCPIYIYIDKLHLCQFMFKMVMEQEGIKFE